MIQLMNDLDEMRESMRTDEAQVHYNMGTIFYHQGKHREARDEFRKSVELAPNDANAHFNLAYVAGDYLHDFQTALDHYQMYLYLEPNAQDAPLVQEKILDAQLNIRAWQEKVVDHEVKDDNPREVYNW